MKLEENYMLCSISITYGNRTLGFHDMRGNFYISYHYKGQKIKTKHISLERYYKFCDKHRGKKSQGYNRPTITYLQFDTKEVLQ